MKDNNKKKVGIQGVDWVLTIVPLGLIGLLTGILLCFPRQSMERVEILRQIFVNDLGFFYLLLGLGVFLTAIGLAFSKYGNIQLGNLEKPKYSNFKWGAMIFTSTMAADILYWSLIEWCYYFDSTPFGIRDMTLAEKQDWASAYPLFHWGPIPWSFYLLPACAYAYMLHVKRRKRQTLSEACRPIIGKQADRGLGKLIDIISIVGLLAGTATTFSLATPLLAQAVGEVFGITVGKGTSILLLFVIGVVFMIAVLKGMRAISHLATICVGIFALLVLFFFFGGPKLYLIETGVTAIGTMIQNFFRMATWMDPLRISGSGSSGFPQDWTVFYWAYWIAWFVATPFFIAKISEGRTIRQTLLGGISCGLLGTYLSFIVFGGSGLYLQVTGTKDLSGMLSGGQTPAVVIVEIFKSLPGSKAALILLILAMIAFYASTFDAITLVVAGYSEKETGDGEPSKVLRAFWAFVFLLLPVGLLFSEGTLNSLQTIAIIAAFPLGMIMLLIISGFFKELRK